MILFASYLQPFINYSLYSFKLQSKILKAIYSTWILMETYDTESQKQQKND